MTPPVMIGVAEIKSPDGTVLRHEAPILGQGDLKTLVSTALDKFRSQYPEVSLLSDEGGKGPILSISHYYK